MNGLARIISLACASLALGVACSSDNPSNGGRGPVPPVPGMTVATGGSPANAIPNSAQGLGEVDNPSQPNGGLAGGGSTNTVVDKDHCTATDITVERVTPVVMLVVDGSTSMLDPYGADMVQRWTAVREALVSPMGVVPMLQDLVKFGLAVYGTQGQCPLPLGVIAPALTNFNAITQGLPIAPPGVFTPSGFALDQVVSMMPDPTLAPPDEEIEPQIIVFATDGDPNDCMPAGFGVPMTNYQPSIDAALKAQSKHLKMYVISVGMDASAAHLQEMANIGAGMDRTANPGASVYYPEDPAALASTLQMLIGAELSCEVKLDGKGVRPGTECKGMVKLNQMPIDCNGENGWELTDSLHITLKGTACDVFKASASTVLSAQFPCDSLVD